MDWTEALLRLPWPTRPVFRLRVWGCVSVVAGVVGCNSSFTGGLSSHKTNTELPLTERATLTPDVSALPLITAGNITPRSGTYLRLTAEECRNLAITHAPFADELDHHPDNAPPNHPRCHKKKADEARLAALVRGHAADELRNRAASDALTDYYQLAQFEGQYDLLVAAHTELKTQLATVEKAIAAHFPAPTDPEELRAQMLDLEAQMARLQAGIGQLNISLRARLGLSTTDTTPIWPADPLRVRSDEVEIDTAVKTGLHFRPDLNLLRVLQAENTPAASELVRSVLGGLNPLLAMAGKGRVQTGFQQLLARCTHIEDKANDDIRKLVASVLTAREKQAEAEIRAAVLNLHGMRMATIARAAEVQRLDHRIAELEKRKTAGQQVNADLVKARLDRLKSRGELIKATTDWHTAEVKLRQMMGLLVRK